MTQHPNPGAVCPECAGPRMVGHPAGVLAWRHAIDCQLRRAEDARQVAVRDLFAEDRRHRVTRGRLTRPATEAEQTLLGACGIAPLPAVMTTVRAVTGGGAVIRRSWAGVAEATS